MIVVPHTGNPKIDLKEQIGEPSHGRMDDKYAHPESSKALGSRPEFQQASMGIKTVFENDLNCFNAFVERDVFSRPRGKPSVVHSGKPLANPARRYTRIKVRSRRDTAVKLEQRICYDRPVLHETVRAFCRSLNRIRADAVKIKRFMKRDDAFCQVERPWGELAVLTSQPADALQIIFHKEFPPEDGHLKHRTERTVPFSFQIQRRIHAVQFLGGIVDVIVADLVRTAAYFIAGNDRARVQVRAGTGANPFVEPFEASFRDRIVTVKEKNVFALCVVDADVSGLGT